MLNVTDAQIIQKFRDLRDEVKRRNEAHEKALAPYAEAMKALENLMLQRLNERGADNSSTEAGTAYKEKVMSVTCEDKNAFLNWCYDNFDDFGKDMLTAAVSKDTLRLYIDKTKDTATPEGRLPPGVKVTHAIVVRFRK